MLWGVDFVRMQTGHTPKLGATQGHDGHVPVRKLEFSPEHILLLARQGRTCATAHALPKGVWACHSSPARWPWRLAVVRCSCCRALVSSLVLLPVAVPPRGQKASSVYMHMPVYARKTQERRSGLMPTLQALHSKRLDRAQRIRGGGPAGKEHAHECKRTQKWRHAKGQLTGTPLAAARCGA